MNYAIPRGARLLAGSALVLACLLCTVVLASPSGADTSLPYFPAAMPLPLPAGATQVETSAMACPSAGNCVVVGDSSDGTTTTALIERQVDGTWITPITTNYSSNTTTLTGVSCSSIGNCTAVGFYQVSGTTDYPIAISETNGNWDGAPTPLLTGTSGYTYTFNSVSCWAPGDCTALGSENNGAESEIALEQSGGSWAPTPVVLPVSGVFLDTFSSISCASAGNCTAVGFVATSAPYDGIVLVESGGAWQNPISLPPPTGYDVFFLLGVSCPSQGNCTAVGATTTSQPPGSRVLGTPSRREDAAAVSETGGQWGAVHVLSASSSNLFNALSSISCVSPGTCTAVGSTEPGHPVVAPLLGSGMLPGTAPRFGSLQELDPIYVSSQGGAWGPIQTASPTNLFLIGVSCATSSSCTMTGGANNSIYVSSSLPQLTLGPPGSTPVFGAAYVGQLTATGGVGPSSYSIASGTLPPGLSLNPSTGTITGTPTSRGTYTITFMATDASNPSQTATTTVTWNLDALAATGFDVLPLAAASMVAFAAGLSLTALVRRRRAAGGLRLRMRTKRSA